MLQIYCCLHFVKSTVFACFSADLMDKYVFSNENVHNGWILFVLCQFLFNFKQC